MSCENEPRYELKSANAAPISPSPLCITDNKLINDVKPPTRSPSSNSIIDFISDHKFANNSVEKESSPRIVCSIVDFILLPKVTIPDRSASANASANVVAIFVPHLSMSFSGPSFGGENERSIAAIAESVSYTACTTVTAAS